MENTVRRPYPQGGSNVVVFDSGRRNHRPAHAQIGEEAKAAGNMRRTRTALEREGK